MLSILNILISSQYYYYYHVLLLGNLSFNLKRVAQYIDEHRVVEELE